MNSNLRSMIEDALDGELQDETFSYDSYEDVPSAYGGDEITKLASALSFVATNLDDLGTTDEKLAELELLQEKIAKATETKAAGEAAEDTLGAFYKNLKGGSTVGLGDAFGKLSTGRKFAVGGTAGLVGLGALYGGAKMLGGGGGEQTNVVKVSSLQDAKQHALVKMAEHYNIPVWELEKIAATKAQANIINFQGELNQRQIDILRGNVESQTGRPLSEKLEKFFKDTEPGKAISADQRKMLKSELVANPTDVSMMGNSPEAVAKRQRNIDRLYGGVEDSRITRQMERKAGGRKGNTRGKGTNAAAAEGRSAKFLEDQKASPKGKAGDSPRALRRKQLQRQGKIDSGQALGGARERAEKLLTDPAERSKAGLPPLDTTNRPVQQYGRTADPNIITQEVVPKKGGDTEVKTIRLTAEQQKEQLKRSQEAEAKLQQQLTERAKGPKRDTLTPEQQKRLEEMQKQREAKATARSEADATARSQRKAGGQAAEKELGFLAKNRRALLGAGALGAAGLAGYGAYKAFGGGGQSKAASYRGRLGGMRKLAEDRISPARIRAGKADPFSGMDIHRPGMSRSASPLEPIGIKAQRIRDQINKDMHGYVSHVGGGYNLDRYLNKFNK